MKKELKCNVKRSEGSGLTRLLLLDVSSLEMSEDVGGAGESGGAADGCFVSELNFPLVSGPDLDLNLISSCGARMSPGLDPGAGLRLGMCWSLG